MSTKSVIIISLIFCVIAMLCICSAGKYRRRAQSHSPLRLSSRAKSSKMKYMQRVWYGYKVWTDQYPFMVKLIYTKANGAQTSCSGSIITSKCVLTAAHCVSEKNLYNFKLQILREKHTVYKYITLKLIFVPKRYNKTTNLFDIGLIVLTRDIEPDEGERQPVSLKDYEVEKVRIFGFGKLAPEEPKGHRLRYFVGETSPWKDCKKTTNSIKINKHVICTKWMKSRIDRGDSGGPMIDWSSGLQVGVTSFVLNYKVAEPWKRDGVSVSVRIGSPPISAWLTKKVENNCN